MKSIRFNITIAVILCLSIHSLLISQNKNSVEYNFQVDKVLEKRITSYTELEDVFKYDTADTLKMMYLASKSKEITYMEGQSFALYNLGVYFRDNSLYNRAIAYHQNAYNLALSTKNIDLQVVNLNMLGVVSRKTDNNIKAIEYHQEALKIAENQKETTKNLKKSIAISYNSIGNIYLTLENPDKAIEHFSKSLSIEKEIGNKLGLAMNYHNIGYALEEKHEIDAALDHYLTSLKYNEEINSFIGTVICNNSISQIHLKRGNPEEAINVLKRNLNLAIEHNDPYYISSTYIGLGWAQYELNKFEESEFNLNRALEIAEQIGKPTFIASANIHLSELYKKMGNYKLAFEKYLISDRINHEISSDANKQYVNMLDKKYETEKINNINKQYGQQLELNALEIEQSRRNQLVVLFGILILAGIFIIINRQRRLKNEKKIITLEQDMLRSQMNPHFIFNSLNSIKLYIINNEKENAVYYLNKFSKLIRKILMASKEKEITLAEELETMDLYMNIENIRFSNEINYKTNISSDIDMEAIKVPSLILQPFLENALWHGLSSKKEDKAINLDITKENGSFIVISIADNGIGRKEAQRIKKNKLLKRKSLGLAITNERLENFYKEYNKDFRVEIKDLYDDNGNALGTKVIITIPIEKAYELRTA